MNYLFIGRESYLKEKAINNLKSKLLTVDSLQLNFNIYYADIDSMEDILRCARTLPFAAKNRIIVIKNIDKSIYKDREILLEYLKSPAKQTALILNSDNELNGNEIWSKFTRFTKKIDFRKPKGRDLDYWIEKEASALNKRISKEAIELIKERLGEDDLFKLRNELEKISLFTGKKIDISKSDVDSIMGKSTDEDIFKLIDAISQKNIDSALNIISKLILKKVKPHEIIGLLAWHFRNISTKSVENRTFIKRNLKTKIEILLSTDLAIKRGRLKPTLALEFAILKLCR